MPRTSNSILLNDDIVINKKKFEGIKGILLEIIGEGNKCRSISC